MSEWQPIDTCKEGDDVILGCWEWQDGVGSGWRFTTKHMPYYLESIRRDAQYWRPSNRPKLPPGQ